MVDDVVAGPGLNVFTSCVRPCPRMVWYFCLLDRLCFVNNNIGTMNLDEAQVEILTKSNVGFTWFLLWNCRCSPTYPQPNQTQCWSNMVLAVGR